MVKHPHYTHLKQARSCATRKRSTNGLLGNTERVVGNPEVTAQLPINRVTAEVDLGAGNFKVLRAQIPIENEWQVTG